MKLEIPGVERKIIISIEGKLQTHLSLPAGKPVTMTYCIMGDVRVE